MLLPQSVQITLSNCLAKQMGKTPSSMLKKNKLLPLHFVMFPGNNNNCFLRTKVLKAILLKQSLCVRVPMKLTLWCISIFKLFPLFLPSNCVCRGVCATDGLFCCVKHFVGGQLYVMRGKSAVNYL